MKFTNDEYKLVEEALWDLRNQMHEIAGDVDYSYDDKQAAEKKAAAAHILASQISRALEDDATAPLIVTRDVELSAKALCDLFVTAFEGGITYWACNVEYEGPLTPEDEEVIWWGSPNIYDHTFKAVLTDGEDDKKYTITWDSIRQGLEKMPARRLANIIDENYDAEDADSFIQCAIFGEEIYG